MFIPRLDGSLDPGPLGSWHADEASAGPPALSENFHDGVDGALPPGLLCVPEPCPSK
eukprot:CAMPEP_0181354472 /NCGR_PEP_ID=MMETSP1106-20121128/3377_1 /TAXON_ID=81844 /ORGANISM="Mantoniella antarctica, Strain SL-175" /LENGTH=56 /DNA_ID=CAMNT_0023467133 /DNA_START=650 /DNA_END=817 /DNA_ORIENTATION=+